MEKLWKAEAFIFVTIFVTVWGRWKDRLWIKDFQTSEVLHPKNETIPSFRDEEHTMTTIQKSRTVGDAAVDGLLAGMAAGVVMAVYLLVTGLIAGETFISILSRFSPGEPTTPLSGALAHLAVSAIYGALFGVIMMTLRQRVPAWATGMAYGVVLFLVARYALLPGTGSSLQEIFPLNFGVAHLIYGGVLAILIGRK
jgi:hypothetical protein